MAADQPTASTACGGVGQLLLVRDGLVQIACADVPEAILPVFRPAFVCRTAPLRFYGLWRHRAHAQLETITCGRLRGADYFALRKEDRCIVGIDAKTYEGELSAGGLAHRLVQWGTSAGGAALFAMHDIANISVWRTIF